MTHPDRADANLFSALPEHLATRLFAQASHVQLAAGEVLFLTGDPGDGCYQVEQGLLKIGIVSPAGGERILAIRGPGAVFGELAMMDGRPRSAMATAVRESRLSFVSKAAFEAFADHHPEIFRYLVIILAARLRDTTTVLAAESFLPLSGRVARSLLELADAFGEAIGDGRIVIRYKIGQSDLAAMAGIARENVNRILGEWKRRKLILRVSGYYCLQDKTKLEREVEL